MKSQEAVDTKQQQASPGRERENPRFPRPAHFLPRPAIWLILGALVLFLFLLDLALGSVRIPVEHSIRFLLSPLAGAGFPGIVEGITDTEFSILSMFRLPKSLTALAAGAALASSGLLMQTLFRNPMAGPFVLGINSGASLGAALVVLAAGGGFTGSLVSSTGILGGASAGAMMLTLAAGAGAALVMLLILAASRRIRNIMTILILGLLFGYAAGAVVNILIHFSSPDSIQSYIAWTFGNFRSVTWSSLSIFAPVVAAGIFGSFLLVKPLNALLLSETYAASMGIRIKRIRNLVILFTAVLAGGVTAFCGPVGFIGVAVPHLARALIRSSDHRPLMPATALLGAAVALGADIISGLPGREGILPLSAVTALIGTPVIIWVIIARRNIQETFAS